MKLSFLLDSTEGAGCLCHMTAQDGTATLSITPPVYDGRPHDTAALEGCYETALDAALSGGCGSVTIPTLAAPICRSGGAGGSGAMAQGSPQRGAGSNTVRA